jgi:prophage antirepressor-like protein/predicted GIY-YIG superfamily endonuclease
MVLNIKNILDRNSIEHFSNDKHEILVSERKFGLFLGLSNPFASTRMFTVDEVVSLSRDTTGGSQVSRCLTMDGIKRLLLKSRKLTAISICQELGWRENEDFVTENVETSDEMIVCIRNLFDTNFEDIGGTTHNVTVYGSSEEPLFKANEIAKVLGINDVRFSMKDFRQNVDSVTSTVCDTLDNAKRTVMLTEAGLYRLLFKSRKKIAVKFQDFVISVIKEIRIRGSYDLNQQLALKDQQIAAFGKSFDIKLRQQNEDSFIKMYHLKKLCYLVLFFHNGRWKIKYGCTTDIERRLKDHKREIGNDIFLVYCIETFDENVLETEFEKNDTVVKNRTEIIGLDGKNKTEIINLLDENEYNKYIKIFQKANDKVNDKDLEMKRLDLELKKVELEIIKEKKIGTSEAGSEACLSKQEHKIDQVEIEHYSQVKLEVVSTEQKTLIHKVDEIEKSNHCPLDFKNFLKHTISPQKGYVASFTDIVENYIGVIPSYQKSKLGKFKQNREILKNEIIKFLKKNYPNDNIKCSKYRLKKMQLQDEQSSHTNNSALGFLNFKFTPIVHQPDVDGRGIMKSSVLSLAINSSFQRANRLHRSTKNFVSIGDVVDTVYNYIIDNNLNNFHNRNYNCIPLKKSDNPLQLDGFKGYQAVFFSDVKSQMIKLGFVANNKPSGFYLIPK